MEVLRVALVMLAIIWSAVFLLALIDRLRGATLRFFGGGRYHLPDLPALRWWQHMIRLPLYILVFAIFHALLDRHSATVVYC